MNNIDFTEYDRITDVLLYLSDNISLNFSVSLSKKNKSGDRSFYHYESLYGSDKYGTAQRSIKRIMNFYFIIDIKDNFSGGILLRPQDVELLIRLIEARVLPWFFGSPDEVAFHIIKDELKLRITPEPVVYAQSESKYICFEPCISSEYDKDLRAIRMSLASGDAAIIPIDKFMGFLHLLRSDMYAVACSLTTYAKQGPYGINVLASQGLGAAPANRRDEEAWKGFRQNSFLDNSKAKNKE